MKSKKIGSKLVLAKSTIANLNEREMGAINGGVDALAPAISDVDTCTQGCVIVSGSCPC